MGCLVCWLRRGKLDRFLELLDEEVDWLERGRRHIGYQHADASFPAIPSGRAERYVNYALSKRVLVANRILTAALLCPGAWQKLVDLK